MTAVQTERFPTRLIIHGEPVEAASGPPNRQMSA